jgi:hypothetical protein
VLGEVRAKLKPLLLLQLQAAGIGWRRKKLPFWMCEPA